MLRVLALTSCLALMLAPVALAGPAVGFEEAVEISSRVCDDLGFDAVADGLTCEATTQVAGIVYVLTPRPGVEVDTGALVSTIARLTERDMESGGFGLTKAFKVEVRLPGQNLSISLDDARSCMSQQDRLEGDVCVLGHVQFINNQLARGAQSRVLAR